MVTGDISGEPPDASAGEGAGEGAGTGAVTEKVMVVPFWLIAVISRPEAVPSSQLLAGCVCIPK